MYFVEQLLSSDSTIVTHDDVDIGLILSLCIILDHDIRSGSFGRKRNLLFWSVGM